MSDTGQMFPALSEADVRRRSEVERRLPGWLSKPTQFPAVNLVDSSQDIDEFATYIDEDLRGHIKKSVTISRLFPVQKCLIPVLANQFNLRQFRRPHDICVSSPTGSGKTLAFVIPIVNYLKKYLNRSLRALVILPSRDLAQQVFKSFQQISQQTRLRCALATGEAVNDSKLFRRLPRHHDERFSHSRYSGMRDSDYEYVSNIDVLISTPGILIDLLQNSPGFSLRDLEILVIDEADRLMVNHHHNWLNIVERAVSPNHVDCPCCLPKEVRKKLRRSNSVTNSGISFNSANGCTIEHSCMSRSLHKLLFSATLSSDPQVLMHMNLFEPRLFLATKPSITGTKIRNSLGSQSSTPIQSPLVNSVPSTVSTKSELLTTTAIPDQLEEKMFITETKNKLYIMWYLLKDLGIKKAICFTNDKRKCYELFVFINQIGDVRAVNCSSMNKPEARQKYLNDFKSGRIDVFVATDLMARGMDIEGVEYVISYDMPASEVWYAHRVGRTARAGKKGTAITLIDSKQIVRFKKIVQHAHKLPNSMRLSDYVEEMQLPPLALKEGKSDSYQAAYENYRDKLRIQQMKSKQVNS